MFPTIILSLGSLLYLAAAVLLVRRYLRTRDMGLLWLAAAIFIWPYLSGLLEWFPLRMSGNHWPSFFPFSLVSQGQITVGVFFTYLRSFDRLVGAILVLVAVLYLTRRKDNSKAQPAVA
ncbi:MAG: hypothetical protein ABI197_09375 [Granulicella sp.]